MAYWITLKRGKERAGFSAATAEEALAMVEAKLRDGYEEIRIVDPDGIETNARYLQFAVDSVEAEPA